MKSPHCISQPALIAGKMKVKTSSVISFEDSLSFAQQVGPSRILFATWPNHSPVPAPQRAGQLGDVWKIGIKISLDHLPNYDCPKTWFQCSARTTSMIKKIIFYQEHCHEFKTEYPNWYNYFSQKLNTWESIRVTQNGNLGCFSNCYYSAETPILNFCEFCVPCFLSASPHRSSD